MSEIANLQPKDVWRFFDLICSIPHISGHESALAEEITRLAKSEGLYAETDKAGNVIIERCAAEGFENNPTMIIQGHLDMVPASDNDFDFINTPISPYIEDGWVKAKGTTLGADNGIGVAHALAIIFDKNLKCGKLRAILTTDEEVGMTGAANLDPAVLEGKYLLNCDSGENGFCIGCAGGARQEFTFNVKHAAEIPAGTPVKISVSGLPGGHSGMCIHENRGNAIKFLAEFIDQIPGVTLASFDGGTVDNAIPRFAVATAISESSVEELRKLADAFAVIIKKDCPNAENISFAIEEINAPESVWEKQFSQNLVSGLALVQDGMAEYDQELDVTKTSTNLASVKSFADKVIIRCSHRSLVNECRDELAASIAEHFRIFGGNAEMGNVYPATTPKRDSFLLNTAIKCAEKINMTCKAYAIHGGLESGWFSQKNPDLEIISCGPEHVDVHTPHEKLNIAAVEEFDRFVRNLIETLSSSK